MHEPLRTMRLEDYLEQLASSNPAPGGGAVVALMGAEAAALLAMALRVTGEVGKVAERQALLEALDEARGRFLALAEADAAAFSAVLQAYQLPQPDDDAKEARKQAVQAAFKHATSVPLEVMGHVASLFEPAEAIAALVKPTVASDVGVAVQLLYAALKASRYNLWINLKYITDRRFKAEVKEAAAAHLGAKKARRQALHKRVKGLIKGK